VVQEGGAGGEVVQEGGAGGEVVQEGGSRARRCALYDDLHCLLRLLQRCHEHEGVRVAR